MSDPSPLTDDATDPVPPWLADLFAGDPDRQERELRHRNEPHISSAQHARRVSLEQGARALACTRIYLDQKYWIYCRNALIGRAEKPVHDAIWRALRELANDGRVICPVAYPIFNETMLQGDPATRRATAETVDLLSRRFALQPFFCMLQTEFDHWLCTRLHPQREFYTPKQLAWTFPGWLVGEAELDIDGVPEQELEWMRKCMFDLHSRADFSMVIEALGGRAGGPRRDATLHCRLNEGSKAFRYEIPTWEKALDCELEGALDSSREWLLPIVVRRFRAPGIPAPTEAEANETYCELCRVIRHAFRLGKLTTELPAILIKAGLHAAVRFRNQPYKPGDQMDFFHAHSALAYCNAFFTERGLAHLLNSKPLAYAELYACRVLCDDEQILSYLQSLTHSV